MQSELPNAYSGTWALRKQKGDLVPRFLSVFLAFGGLTPSDSIHSGGPTSSSADFSVPRQRFHAALGSSLIT